jgi:hypothetical protein
MDWEKDVGEYVIAYASWNNNKAEINYHYYKMCPSSLWVSLDFEWIWTFLLGEIV